MFEFTSARGWSRLWGAVHDFLLPPFCLLCGPLVDEGELPGLCSDCAATIPVDARRLCEVCAQPLAGWRAPYGRCLGCQRRRPAYRGLDSLGTYEGILETLIVRLKYAREMACARPLARLLAEREGGTLHRLGREAEVDVIVPVPLDPDRRAERGFNQADLIARELASLHNAKLAPALLRRRRGRGPQVGPVRLGPATAFRRSVSR